METKNLTNEMTNVKALNECAKGAKLDVKSTNLGIMYYVNQLNKLAKKNEFIEGVNLFEFGKRVQEYSKEKDLFTARVFTPDSANRPCFKKVAKNIEKPKTKGFDIVSENEYLQPITLSLVGLINAYSALLKVDAKAKDGILLEDAKRANKAQKASEKEQAKATKKAQKDAKKRFLSGEISAEEYENILRCLETK